MERLEHLVVLLASTCLSTAIPDSLGYFSLLPQTFHWTVGSELRPPSPGGRVGVPTAV